MPDTMWDILVIFFTKYVTFKVCIFFLYYREETGSLNWSCHIGSKYLIQSLFKSKILVHLIKSPHLPNIYA